MSTLPPPTRATPSSPLPHKGDLIQCVSWNGTYSLEALYHALDNPAPVQLSEVPHTSPSQFVTYTPCHMALESHCLVGTHVGLLTIRNDGSQSCTPLASKLGVFERSFRGFSLVFDKISIAFECNLGAGIGAPVVASTSPWKLVWQTKYVCPSISVSVSG